MTTNPHSAEQTFKPIDDNAVVHALNEVSRSINISGTYGKNHPATKHTLEKALAALTLLFLKRKRIFIGGFGGTLTVDEAPVLAEGTLLKSLERRLVRLRITGLRIGNGITFDELAQLVELLSCNEADAFAKGMAKARLPHIVADDVSFQAVRKGQTVAKASDVSVNGRNHGVLVLDDTEFGEEDATSSPIQVQQIVAFLKGDIDADAEGVGKGLAEAMSDPTRLGQMIMESVRIRQSMSEFSGETLSDIVLGCLRRTYDGLRKQPAFQTPGGVADLRKALLLLEESVLEKMRKLAGDAHPELDRQIVQAIREMDETLAFEMAAHEYMQHRQALEQNKQELQSYVHSHGADAAAQAFAEHGFPPAEWKKIVIETHRNTMRDANPPIASGLNTLAMVFEKLENLMRSKETGGSGVKDLLGQASENLDDTIYSTRAKLDSLSRQLGKGGTIGGQGRDMKQEELLAALSEVAQELMQPLTAINASLEMMLGGYVGGVTDDQRDLLELASNSGEHLNYLMRELIGIVGCPENKGVDRRFHTTSEQVVLMKQE